MTSLLTPGIDLDVTYVNPDTKKGKHMIYAYLKSTKFDIYDAYKKPSSHKVSAFLEIKEEMKEANGETLKITGAGSDVFSCAYTVWTNEGRKYLIYHTPVNRFAIPM